MPRRAAPRCRPSPAAFFAVDRCAPCTRVVSQSPIGFLRSIPLPSADWTTSLGLFGGKNLDQSKPPICGHRVIYILYYRWAVPSSTILLPTTYYIPSLPFLGSTFSSAASESQLYQGYRDYVHILNTVPRRFSFEKN